jgi:hypothetical protein
MRSVFSQFLTLAVTNALGNINPQSDTAHQIQKTLISALKLN